MPKYQIFISSTYEDLSEEREQVIKAILEMGHIPVGMEMFSAADDAQWNIIKRQIDHSDYYLVVVATRYSSTAESGVSYTEKEYDYAVEQKIPAIGFILDDSAPWPTSRSDSSVADRRARLDAFKDKLRKRLISQWKSADDLSVKVVVALTKLMTEHPRPGWVRGSEVPTADVLNEMSRLSKENADLREQLNAKNAEGDIDDKIRYLRRRPVAVPLSDGDATEVDLLFIFQHIGWQLTMPTTVKQIAELIVQSISDREGVESIPEGLESTSTKRVVLNFDYALNLLAELSILELVESTLNQQHTLEFPRPYTVINWTLTNLGKRVLARLGTPSDARASNK